MAGILIIYILVFFILGRYELSPDEAYWWVQSKFFSLSYYDHPPLTTYILAISTKIFGDNEYAVRIPAITLNFLTLIVLKNLFNLRYKELFITQAVLMFNAGRLIYTHDVLLVFLSLLFGYVYKKYEKNFMLHGFIFGLMLLTKYTAVLLLPAYLISLALSKNLKTKHLFSFFSVAFFLFSPVVLWNFENGFPSFKYRLEAGFIGEKSILNIFRFLAGQLLVLSAPLSFYFFYASIRFFFKSLSDRFNLFISLASLFPFSFFLITSFFKEADANWPSISQIYILGIALMELKNFKYKKAVYFFSYLWFILIVILHIHLITGFLKIRNDRTSELRGFNNLAIFVKEISEKYNARIYANTYQIASELSFYLTKNTGSFFLVPSLNINSRRNHFDYIEYEKPVGRVVYIGPRLNLKGELLYSYFYNHPDGVIEINVIKL